MDTTRCNCRYDKRKINLFDKKHCDTCDKPIKPGTGLVEEIFGVRKENGKNL